MKKFFIAFMLSFPLTAFADGSALDKYVKVNGSTATVDVAGIISEYSSSETAKNQYKAGGNKLSIQMEPEEGLFMSCWPGEEKLAKGTVIREKSTQLIQKFVCGGDINMAKVEMESAELLVFIYNELLKYGPGAIGMDEELVYMMANDRKDPKKKIKRYDEDDGEKESYVSEKRIAVTVEGNTFPFFKK